MGAAGTRRMGKPAPTRNFENRILAALPLEEYARLKGSFQTLPLRRRTILNEPRRPVMDTVYFPRTAVASMVTKMEDGSTLEIATVGNEGIVGLPVLLGTDTMRMDVFIQIDGEAVALPASVIREAVRGKKPLGWFVQRYTQAFLSQIAQSAACNQLHPIDRRCARWLLMSHDRVPGDEFPVTQEFLAQMLGVRRATVTSAASILQRAGFVRYHRGRVRIVDREGLESASCECYRVMRAEYERLIG
jgi:CRP-like cAMP-binding protein